MVTSSFMKIVGIKQGLISDGAFTPESVGHVYQEGHEDEIYIESYNCGSTLPTNENGFISGTRVHKSLSVTKLVDKSSPLLMEALNKGETLSEVELKLYRTSYTGMPQHYFTIALTDAVVSSLDLLQSRENVDFRYRKIEFRHETASTSSSDDLRIGPEATKE